MKHPEEQLEPLHTCPVPQLAPLVTVPPQVPLVHWSLLVQGLPSLQVVPLAWLVHAEVDTLGLHTWQALLGLTWPEA
jgi:hypothetical protein